MENITHTLATNIQKFAAQNRGKADYGWLKTNYSFSFAQYFNPERIHFGALRVLNDDIVAGGAGFDTHPHDNMEIITIPFFGTLRHQDSMGHVEDIKPNEVQVMSAGTGIFHSESNPSKTESVGLFQIWIMPEKRNVEPVYNQTYFDTAQAQNQWQLLVGPNGHPEAKLTINQQAYVSRVFLTAGQSIDYTPQDESYGSYLMVVDGSVNVDGTSLEKRDAAGIINSGTFQVKAITDAYLINIEVPNLPERSGR
jgi:quercetin 2,3-dioxygenase